MAMPKPPCPPTWNGTIFYGDKLSSAGWSETYYVEAPDQTAALTFLQAIKDARRDLMSSQYQAVYMRISNPNIRGDAYIFDVPPAQAPGTIDKNGLPPEMAAEVRSETVDGQHTIRYLHGLAIDQATTGHEIDPAVNGWAANFVAYENVVVAHTALWTKDLVTHAFVLKAIADLRFKKVRSRHVGRPFGLYRGRRVKSD
jgi:hypothetical protein